jgi:hypothetical protein
MSIPTGTGPYLLMIDLGSDGHCIHRFQTQKDLLDAVRDGSYIGWPLLFAKELTLSIAEDGA